MFVNPTTDRPICVMDGNAITTVRTDAAGAVSLQLLDRPVNT
ncbi:MAG: hypothetical protein HEQ17_14105 [Limnohabitans sp.]|nr:hypothetical protein [Limnohabitans sp.]